MTPTHPKRGSSSRSKISSGSLLIHPSSSSTSSPSTLPQQPHEQNQIDLKPSPSIHQNTNSPTNTINPSSSNSSNPHSQPHSQSQSQSHSNPRPLACGRRRRHTISNNHIEFMFYHCLRDDIDEEEEDEHEEEEEEEEDSSYHRISTRRQDQSLFDIHHCDVIVLKTDNGWCFDQDIFLPAWKRDAYEAAGQVDSFSSQEFVKVDEIRID